MGTRPGVTCRDFFKTLKIFPLTSQYIYSLALFIANNIDKFKVKSDIHNTNTRNRTNLFQQLTKLAIYQKGP